MEQQDLGVGVREEVDQLVLEVPVVHVDRRAAALPRGEDALHVLDRVVEVARDLPVVARARAPGTPPPGARRGRPTRPSCGCGHPGPARAGRGCASAIASQVLAKFHSTVIGPPVVVIVWVGSLPAMAEGDGEPARRKPVDPPPARHPRPAIGRIVGAPRSCRTDASPSRRSGTVSPCIRRPRAAELATPASRARRRARRAVRGSRRGARDPHEAAARRCRRTAARSRSRAASATR